MVSWYVFVYVLIAHATLNFVGLVIFVHSMDVHCKYCSVPSTPNTKHTYGVPSHQPLAGVFNTPTHQCAITPSEESVFHTPKLCIMF